MKQRQQATGLPPTPASVAPRVLRGRLSALGLGAAACGGGACGGAACGGGSRLGSSVLGRRLGGCGAAVRCGCGPGALIPAATRQLLASLEVSTACLQLLASREATPPPRASRGARRDPCLDVGGILRDHESSKSFHRTEIIHRQIKEKTPKVSNVKQLVGRPLNKK